MEILVDNCFPITYTKDFYYNLPIKHKKYARLVLYRGVVVGGLCCWEEEEVDESKKGEYFLHLMIILVLKEYRRKRIASKLMDFVYE